MFRVRKEMWMVIVALTLLVMVFAPNTRAAGQRLVAQVNEPFEVDGRIFPAGQLSVREVRDYSPVSSLNQLCVDGTCLSLWLARESKTAGVSSADELIFTRNDAGILVLVGMALAGEPTRELCSMQKAQTGRPTLIAMQR